MTGEIFLETLRRHWRPALFWGIGFGMIVLLNVVAIPDVDALQQMSGLLETMPPAILQLFGMTDFEYMATAEGYLGSQMFMLFVVIIGMYAITAGLNVTANDEERGIMDNVLALPIPRWQLVLERMLAFALLMVGVLVVIFLIAWFSLIITPTLEVDIGKLAVATLNALPSLLLLLAFTVLVGAVVRRRGLALGIAIAFLAASWLIDNLGQAASGSVLADLRRFSFHAYYNGMAVLRDGLNVGNIIILLAAAVLAGGFSLIAYQRRDIGV
jgi:ABC-type transport system involved in multi-copper enzyme maturation permease subunit